jgi:hypothetical protein
MCVSEGARRGTFGWYWRRERAGLAGRVVRGGGALSATAPALAGGALVLRGGFDANPEWSSGRAAAGGFLVKFALSAPTARRLWHEARVLGALGGRPGLRLPALVVVCDDPVHLVVELAAGGPLSYDLVSSASGPQVRQIADELAGFLAGLHQPATLARVAAALGAARCGYRSGRGRNLRPGCRTCYLRDGTPSWERRYGS